MSTLRRQVTAVLAGASCLALVACSSGPNAAGKDEAGGEQTLGFGLVRDQTGIFAKLIADFEAKNPGIKVKLEQIPGDQYQTQMRTRLGAGTAPDVVAVFPGDGSAMSMKQVQKGKFLADLSGRTWAGSRPEAVKSVSDLDGKTYLSPSWLTLIGGIYDTDALKAVGATIPTTFTEVLKLCDTAKAKGKVAYALGAQAPWVAQLIDYSLVATNVYADSADFDTKQAAKQATFKDSGWKKSMEQYVEMTERGCFNQGPLGTTYDAALRQIAEGKALGAVQVSPSGAAIAKINAKTKLALAPFPAGDDPAKTKIAAGSGYGFGVTEKSANKDLAMKFVDYLSTPEVNAQLAESNGSLPYVIDDSTKPTPYNELMLPFVKDGRMAIFMDQNWPSPKIQGVHTAGIQGVIGGKAQIDTVLDSMQKEYDAGLATK